MAFGTGQTTMEGQGWGERGRKERNRIFVQGSGFTNLIHSTQASYAVCTHWKKIIQKKTAMRPKPN